MALTEQEKGTLRAGLCRVYNPGIHITAEELRGIGCNIPLEIPDRAWTLRCDMEWEVGAVEAGLNPREFKATIQVKCTDFFWGDA